MGLFLGRRRVLIPHRHHTRDTTIPFPLSFFHFCLLAFTFLSSFAFVSSVEILSTNPPPRVCQSTLFPTRDPFKDIEKGLNRCVDPPPKNSASHVSHSAYSIHSHRTLEEHKMRITEYVHTSGLSVWSISTPPSEKELSCSICFRTPVKDSTGLPHVLEHVVLKGSEGFPVKSAFSHLLGSSLQTYLNASTWADRTCFLFASLNRKDFYNILKVYLDAVFRPLATKDPFQLQEEGWRLQLVPKKSSSGDAAAAAGGEAKKIDCAQSPSECRLLYNGVVYNEMKGTFSNPETAEEIYRRARLFPNIKSYKECSGGVPTQIPSLTLENLKEFHHKHYTLGNAYVVIYGYDDVWERLDSIDRFISANRHDINPNQPAVHVGTQIQFKAPVFAEYAFASRASELKDLVTVSWVLNPCKEQGDKKALSCNFFDGEARIAFKVLEYLLAGTTSSPLYKALADSELGEAVLAPGVDFDLQHATYTVGLKEVKQTPTCASEIEALTVSVLERLSASGFEPKEVAAALNSTEFSLREFPRKSLPRGLVVAKWMAQQLNYYRYPVEALVFEEPLKKLKRRLTRGEKVFEDMIKKYFLDNPHRLTLRMKASSTRAAELEKEQTEALDKLAQELGTEGLKKIAKQEEEMQKRQATPPTRKELDRLPKLTKNDIAPKGEEIPAVPTSHYGVPFLTHDVPSEGVVYADLVVSLSSLGLDDIYYLPFLTGMMLEAGTSHLPAEDLLPLIGRITGGVNASFAFKEKPTRPMTIPEPYQATGVLMLSAKALAGQARGMWCLLQHILTSTDFSNRAAGLRVIKKTISDRKAAFTNCAFREAETAALSSYSLPALMDEYTTGYKSLLFHRQLLKEAETDWDAVASKLDSIRKLLLRRCNLLINLTGGESDVATAVGSPLNKGLKALIDSLPACTEATPASDPASSDEPEADLGWEETEKEPQWAAEAKALRLLLPAQKKAHIVASQVSDFALAAPVLPCGKDYSGFAVVALSQIEHHFLRNRIREQGGAYGTWARFLPTGIVTLLTYRDPNPANSLAVFGGAPAFLEAWAQETATDEGKETLVSAMLPVIGFLDRPLSTEEKGRVSLFRFIKKETEEDRKRFRNQVLKTDATRITSFAKKLKRALLGKPLRGGSRRGAVALIGPEAAAKTLEDAGLQLEITEVE